MQNKSLTSDIQVCLSLSGEANIFMLANYHQKRVTYLDEVLSRTLSRAKFNIQQ